MTRDLASGAQQLATPPNTQCSLPSSSYNPSISGDGRYVAFECSEGNLNFAKRYGQISVFVRDTVAEATQAIGVPRDRDRAVSRSFYNPAISADGRRLAFEAVRRDGQTEVLVRDLQTGLTRAASHGLAGNVYEPSISGDGRMVAFTTAPRSGAASRVYVRDLATDATTLVSRASGSAGAVGDAFASNPAISTDGRFVAFTSAARNLASATTPGAGTRVYLRDLVSQTTTAVSAPQDGFALDPAISADGRVIAYTSVVDGDSRVLVHDMTSGASELASRATGATGARADSDSRDPSISADGTRVAFASAAMNLSTSKPDDRRGVFVRDLVADTTTLVSVPSGAQ